jgi:photosystem II stability/assembly factor-like uncharacterized protein
VCLRSDDAGKTWQPLALQAGDSCTTLTMGQNYVPSNLALLSAPQGKIYFSTQQGKSWISIAPGAPDRGVEGSHLAYDEQNVLLYLSTTGACSGRPISA